MDISHFILACGWIVYCVLHSVFASVAFKKLAQQKMGKQYGYYRLYYTLFAFVFFVVLIAYLLLMPSFKMFLPTTVTSIAGATITTLGAVIMLVCIKKYFMQLSGLRSLIETRKHDQLMITGIHKHVRHPLYAGTFIFIWGLWLLLPSLALFISNLIITIYTLIGIRFEENKLENEFGEAYREYQRKVPMIVPRGR
jgi:protein-S-isoprenylcysteine O-methyltransferase Ste14